MTCSRSLICQTKPPALLATWSGSMRNHCGTAARMSFDWAAWAVIAWAAAEGFLEGLALLVDDFLMGMTRLNECRVFGCCMILENYFNFMGVRPPTTGTTFWWGFRGGSAPYDGNYVR